jgi:hypothetical protein
VPDGAKTVLNGTRDGVQIRVVVDSGTGDIITGYPTNFAEESMNNYTASYYEELRGNAIALLILVADKLPKTTVQHVTEMVDANESGLALETLSEVLAESRQIITNDAFTLVADLVETMGLDQVVVDRLRPFVSLDGGHGNT